jgi:hypothetical protein
VKLLVISPVPNRPADCGQSSPDLQSNRASRAIGHDVTFACVLETADDEAMERRLGQNWPTAGEQSCGSDLNLDCATMPDDLVTVENLSKSYLLGHRTGEWGRYHHTLHDVIAREARNFARKATDVFRGQLQECELRGQEG